MSEVLDTTGEGREAAIARAAELLQASRLVIVPTDTVYGIAADAFDLDATAALLTAKERDRDVPLPVLVRSPKQLPGIVAAVPAAAEQLIAAFWPGPLTLVLPAKGGLKWDLGRSDGVVSVRMPLDEVALELIRSVGPLAVTAANAPGGEPPTTADQASAQLGARVAAVLDDGPREEQQRSTIVDLTRSHPQVLREGAVPTALVLDVAEGRVDPVEAAAVLAAAARDADHPQGAAATSGGTDQPGDADATEPADPAGPADATEPADPATGGQPVGTEGAASDEGAAAQRPLEGLERRGRDGRAGGK